MTHVELTLGAPASGGGFVARGDDGRVYFVRHGLPGERVRAVVTEEHAKWARADAIEILEASGERVDPPCAFAGPGKCGGCDYQHASRSSQLALKTQLLQEQLRRIGKFDLDVKVEDVESPNQGLGTRTRLRFGVSPTGQLGMRRHGSHDLIPTPTCLLGVSPLQETMTKTSLWDESDDVLIIALPQSDSVEVRRVMFTENEHDLIDEEGDSDLSDTDLQETHVGHMSFKVSASSFWQIHEQAPEILVGEVLQGLDLVPGDHVMDLYCGAGLFTKFIAEKVGPLGSVIGIESSQSAVEDATRNLVEYPWTYIQHASVNKRSIEHASPLSTHAVLDPPRSGNDRSALLALNDLEHLRRIVSVACDPATFARDLRILVDLGWEIVSLRAFDLFPMTEHLECTAVLERSTSH